MRHKTIRTKNEPMVYDVYHHFTTPESNQPNQMGSVVHSQAPMMYQQEQQFMRPESNQLNQMGNAVHTQAPMMYREEQRRRRARSYVERRRRARSNLEPRRRARSIVEQRRRARSYVERRRRTRSFNDQPQPQGSHRNNSNLAHVPASDPLLSQGVTIILHQTNTKLVLKPIQRLETNQQNQTDNNSNQSLAMQIADLVERLQIVHRFFSGQMSTTTQQDRQPFGQH